jgi:multidrug efflux system outer membrane protein
MRVPVWIVCFLAGAVAVAGAQERPAPAPGVPAGPTGPAGSATPAEGAAQALTLDEVLELARKSNYDLAAARARLHQTAVQVAQARVALLPQITGQGKYTYNTVTSTLDVRSQFDALFGLGAVIQATSGNPAQNAAIDRFREDITRQLPSGPITIIPTNQLDAVLAATVPLIVPSAYPALKAARRSVAAAEATLANSESQVLYTTAQAFFTAAGTDELLMARIHAVDVAERTYNDAKARFEAGTNSRVDVMRAELSLVRARQAVTDARDARLNAYGGLATMIQLRTPFQVAPAKEAQATALVDTPLDRLTEQALVQRPDYVSLERMVQASRAQILSSRLRWLPTISGFANFRAFNYRGFQPQFYNFSAGVQLDWVLFDGGARYAQRRLQEGQLEETQARLRLLHDTVRDEIATAQRTLGNRRNNFDTAQRSVTLAQETLNLVRAQYEAGTVTQLDLLQAQDSLVSAEVTLAQARFDLSLAELGLSRTVGLFPAKPAP